MIKGLLTVVLGIVAINLLVIAGIAGIVWFDYLKSRRRRRKAHGMGEKDARANLS